jgi:hypothetical protein
MATQTCPSIFTVFFQIEAKDGMELCIIKQSPKRKFELRNDSGLKVFQNKHLANFAPFGQMLLMFFLDAIFT